MVPGFLLLIFILWLQFQSIECKGGHAMCALVEPSQVSHKYYQSGDLIIGAIGTQFCSLLDELSFSDQPGLNFIQKIL